MTSILKVQNIQYTDGDAALTIADGGGVTAATSLGVSSAANSAITLQTSNNGASVSSNYTTPNRTYYTGVDIGGVNSSYTIYDGNASAERFKLDSSGNVTINSGNLVIGTAGKGIDFSATADGSGTDTSEVLSDYEEGTWTPYFLTGHSYGPSYAEQFGRYVKIGSVINAQYWIRMSGTLHSDGAAVRIAGLPYVLGKSGNENPDSYARGLGSTGFQDYNNNVPVPYGDNGLATFSLYYNSNTSWIFGSNGSTHGGGKYFIGGITYTVDM